MHLAALLFGLLASVTIIVLGLRFVLRPGRATRDFGIAPDSARGLAATKGARDVTSGVLMLVVWAAAGRSTLGWAMAAVALTPIADALIVVTNGGKLAHALSVHALTAALLIAAGLVLALG